MPSCSVTSYFLINMLWTPWSIVHQHFQYLLLKYLEALFTLLLKHMNFISQFVKTDVNKQYTILSYRVILPSTGICYQVSFIERYLSFSTQLHVSKRCTQTHYWQKYQVNSNVSVFRLCTLTYLCKRWLVVVSRKTTRNICAC